MTEPMAIIPNEMQRAESISDRVQTLLKNTQGFTFEHQFLPTGDYIINHFLMTPKVTNSNKTDSQYGFKLHIPSDYKDAAFLETISKVAEVCDETKTRFKILNPQLIYNLSRWNKNETKQIVIYPDRVTYDRLFAFNYSKTQELVSKLEKFTALDPLIAKRNVEQDIRLADGIFAGFGGMSEYLQGDKPNSPFWESLSTIAIDPVQKIHVLTLLQSFDKYPPKGWKDTSILANN